MFDLKIDASEFERKVEQMGAAIEQMPFALSRALNDAAKETRHTLIDQTWPSHVTVRNRGFLSWALRTEFSTKYDLRVVIYDQQNRGHLKLHAEGGIKQARGRLAIPTQAVKVGAHGVRANQKPASLENKVVIGNAIYQRQGRGKRKLVKMYTLAASANQPADVPFNQDFQTAMRASITAHFPVRMMEAMRTAR